MPLTSTLSDIKTAYRKLALRHHPDKAAPDQQAAATVVFSKISNAYEVLSDEQQRREYDYGSSRGPTGSTSTPFAQNQQTTWQQGHDPFASSSFFQRHHFHDPFQVFEQVFRDEFGGGPSMRGGHRPGGSLFNSFFDGGNMMDPFASDFFTHRGSGGGMMDPFQRGSMFASGGGMMDPFAGFGMAGGGNPGFTSTMSVSSSTTTTIGGPGGESVTTQTTRKLVNGREEMVTERIVRKADGTVTRQVLDESGRPMQQLESEPSRRDSRRLAVQSGPVVINVDDDEDGHVAASDSAGHKHARRDSTGGVGKRPRKKQES